MERGIVLLGENAGIAKEAQKRGWGVVMRDEPCVPWPAALILATDVFVPWDLLDAGFGMLERWDMAAVLLPDRLASGAGEVPQREIARHTLRDLRIPLYETGLVFARKSPVGEAVVTTWCEGISLLGSPLALLCAIHRVKPRLCALPPSWLTPLPKGPVVGGKRKALSGRKPRHMLYWDRMRRRPK